MRQRFVITGFVLFHLLGMFCWALPIDLPLIQALKNFLHPYFSLCNLDQTWNMFAPDPLVANSYELAQITFEDGSLSIWSFPRMEDLSLLDRYKKERYRKFTNDWLWREQHSELWPDTAHYIAREASKSLKRPSSIRLIRYSSAIPSPGSPKTALRWKQYIVFNYQVDESDLR